VRLKQHDGGVEDGDVAALSRGGSTPTKLRPKLEQRSHKSTSNLATLLIRSCCRDWSIPLITTGLLFALLLPQQPDPLYAARWRAELTWEIGYEEDGVTFGRIMDIATSQDGAVFALDLSNHAVAVLRPPAAARLIGREGSGPGEFRAPSSLGFLGDTLWVRDPRLMRLTFFDHDGQVLRTAKIGSEGEGPYRPTLAGALLPRGTAVVELEPSQAALFRMGGGASVLATPILIVNRENEPLDTLAWVPVRDKAIAIRGTSYVQITTPQPFADGPTWGMSRHRGEVVIVNRESPSSSADSTFTIRWHDYLGRVLRERSYSYSPKPISSQTTDSLFSFHVDRLVASTSWLDGRQRAYDAVRAALYIPDFYSPVRQLVVGQDGTVWLQTLGHWRTGTTWIVLSELGDPIGSVEAPAGLRIMAASRDHFWGIQLGRLDVQLLAMYTIQRE
jgi:hypothetical protein